jgi:hypothetical protein
MRAVFRGCLTALFAAELGTGDVEPFPVVDREVDSGCGSEQARRVQYLDPDASVMCPFRSLPWHRRVPPEAFYLVSGGRGIRTHGDVAATMVFKTIAIGH